MLSYTIVFNHFLALLPFIKQKTALIFLQIVIPYHPPANGSLSSEDVIAGTSVTLSCDNGFSLFGNETLLCQDNGVWNGSVGTCKKGIF